MEDFEANYTDAVLVPGDVVAMPSASKGLGAGSGQGLWFRPCVAAGAGAVVGLGRRLRGAAERGGWARMWSRTRVMTSPR